MSGQCFCMNGQFDLGAVKPSHYFFAVALVLGILFGLIVPIQDDQNRLMMVIQWIMQSVVPMALLVGSHVALQKNSRFSHSNPWFKLSLSGLVGSALYAPITPSRRWARSASLVAALRYSSGSCTDTSCASYLYRGAQA